MLPTNTLILVWLPCLAETSTAWSSDATEGDLDRTGIVSPNVQWIQSRVKDGAKSCTVYCDKPAIESNSQHILSFIPLLRSPVCTREEQVVWQRHRPIWNFTTNSLPNVVLKVTQSLPIKLLAILFCPVTMVISAAPLPPNCTPSLATPGTAAKISAACWGERQSPVCTRRGTQQKSPNSCLLLPVDPANLLRFFAYNMLQQTHCPKRTELNWVAGLQITKQPHFNHGYSSAKECRK